MIGVGSMFNVLLMEFSQTMPLHVKVCLFLAKAFILYGISGIAYLSVQSVRLLTSYINIKKYEIDMDNGFTIEEANVILDTMIQECLNSYIFINGIAVSEYITEDQENEINKLVSTMVADSMSSILVTRLSKFYDVEYLATVISRKIYVLTTEFTVQKNKER